MAYNKALYKFICLLFYLTCKTAYSLDSELMMKIKINIKECLDLSTWMSFKIFTERRIVKIKLQQRDWSPYVHGDTTDFRPAVPLCLVLMVRPTCLQHWLVNSPTTSNNTCQNTLHIIGKTWLTYLPSYCLIYCCYLHLYPHFIQSCGKQKAWVIIYKIPEHQRAKLDNVCWLVSCLTEGYLGSV